MMDILRSHLRSVLRNLYRLRWFSFINIGGLGLAFSAIFYIILFLHSEFSYENMHSKADRIYRLTWQIKSANQETHWARVDLDWVNALKSNFGEVEELIRFQDYDPRSVKVGEDLYTIPQAFSCDAEVFRVFDFTLKAGNPKTALAAPNSVVLTESMAHRFFGLEEAMGKEIQILGKMGGEKKSYTVTGIMEDLAMNTHLPVNLLTSFSSPQDRTSWAYVYLLLKPGAKRENLAAKIPDFIDRYADLSPGTQYELPLQNLAEIHLNSNLAREIVPNGNYTQIISFAGVGLIILLLSLINFINLNTAQTLQRQGSIQTKYFLGASKRQLKHYFLLEANVMAFLASILALVLIGVCWPFFQSLAPVAQSAVFILPFFLLISILMGTLGGYYPSLILKGLGVLFSNASQNLSKGKKEYSIMFSLVALQLLLCTALLSATFIGRAQFRYLLEKDLGLNSSQVLSIQRIPFALKENFSFFKEQLLKIPGVEMVSGSMEVPSREIRDMGPVMHENFKGDKDSAPIMDIQVIEDDFVALMDIPLLAGRNIGNIPGHLKMKEHLDDPLSYLQNQAREYLINEEALKILGEDNPQEIIGKKIAWSIGDIRLQEGPIVGVVKNFHQESLRNKIEPLVLINEPYWIGHVLVKLSGPQLLESMKKIEDLWQTSFPEAALETAFINDLYEQLYQTEHKQVQLIYIFTSLALIIAFMGIFGMLAFSLKIREKEMAIRRVLGATINSLGLLLTRRLLKLSFLGLAIALPLTYLGMQYWLDNFAYRINLNGFSFMAASMVVLGVLFLSLVLHLNHLARVNPADILKNE